MQIMMALMTLVGIGMTRGGLGLTFHELVVALRGQHLTFSGTTFSRCK
jgi:hypothetical protein